MKEHDRLIPISSLNHYSYCRRRCALIHVDGEFRENVHTTRGRLEHELADAGDSERLGTVRVARRMSIWHEELGLIGLTDIVEFHDDGRIFPVEYKHGRRRRWVNDDLQLCAQALCLEQMLGRQVVSGAIFHRGSRRRREVRFAAALRELVRATVAEVRALLASSTLPPPVLDRRCVECSMKPNCLPEIGQVVDAPWLFRAEAVTASRGT